MQEKPSSEENSLIKFQNEGTKIKYPKAPPKNNSLRYERTISLTSNLMQLEINPMKRIYVYSIEISPEIEKDNFTLQNKIYKNLEEQLSKIFTKKAFAGYNLFGVTKEPKEEIILNVNVENKDYTITFKKTKPLDFKLIKQNGDEIILKVKGFIEKLIKNILLSSKGTMRFGTDRMIMKISEDNIIMTGDKGRIYKGYYTSVQITESGLNLMVLNMNKYVSGKTMLEKLNQIRNENNRAPEGEIREIIEEYLEEHKTVLTSYGSLRAYRIERIDFDRTPLNTSFNIKTSEGNRTVTLINYYETQYHVKIRDKNQPLLVAENKLNNKKLLNDKKENAKEEKIIYLIPELVYITGIEDDRNSRGRRQDIIAKTKTTPQQRMSEINKIHELMNSNEAKEFKKRNGEKVISQTSKQLAEEWGIKLGDNLKLQGRILSQPKLVFDKKANVIPRNGLFRTEGIYDGVKFTRDNLLYIFDKRDRADFKALLGALFGKARAKGIRVEVRPHEVQYYGLNRTNNWNAIRSELNNIRFSNQLRMVIVFLNNNLQIYYTRLKEFLTNEKKINSQFMESRRLSDPRRAGSIMFNIVEQMNIKMGGANFYIDFSDHKIIDDKVYLIAGLESKKVGKDQIDYVLTYAFNSKLNRTHTIPRTCKDNKEEKEKILNEMMDEAILGLREKGNAPHPPNFVIIYRQGGNHAQNLKIKQDEIPIFVNYLNNKKEKIESFKKYDTKLIYVCCNLKGELKFFEENDKDNAKQYLNPPSGLCVDSSVVQKDKYEFYIQPQFVNQGTATPCHFEILYQDEDKDNPEKNFPMEKLQNLSFQLSFYYWTWSGAVRVPGVLRLSTTALDYYSRCLNHKLNLNGQKFITPGFI